MIVVGLTEVRIVDRTMVVFVGTNVVEVHHQAHLQLQLPVDQSLSIVLIQQLISKKRSKVVPPAAFSGAKTVGASQVRGG